MNFFLVFVLLFNSFKAEQIWLVKFSLEQNDVPYIEEKFPLLDLLEYDYNESSYIFLVPKIHLKNFASFIHQSNGFYRVISNKTPRDWKKPRIRSKRTTLSDDPLDKTYIQRFPSYDEQQQWYDLLSNYSSTKGFIRLHNIGQTYENRSLTVVQIRSKYGYRSRSNRKLSVFIDGGMHAREWLSIGVANFILAQFLKLKDSNRKVKKVLGHFNIYILSMMNPDGYEYSRKENRLWRKNRAPIVRPYTNIYESNCFGVDLNRNFPHRWHPIHVESLNPCSPAFAGSNSLSESEARSVVNFIEKFKNSRDKFHAYFNLHAFGRLWLLPWTHSPYEKVWNYEDLFNRSQHIVSKVLNNTYRVGQASTLLYPCTGTSIDFASTLMPHSMTFELSPTYNPLTSCTERNLTAISNCTIGFLSGPEMIETDGTEIFNTIIEYLTSIINDKFL